MPEPYSIFASVGNSRPPFDRFLRMVDEAARRVRLATLIQTGASTYQPRYAEAIDFVPRARFEELALQARYVVTHAGVGSAMTAVRCAKIPILIARRMREGEAPNDHQLELATQLGRLGWCRVVSDLDQLLAVLQKPPERLPENAQMSNWLMRELVSEFIG